MKYLPTLETERLIIRPITMDDLQDFYEMDSQPEVHTFLKNQPIKTIDETREIIENLLIQYNELGHGRVAVIEKESGKMIGWTGFKYMTEKETMNNRFDFLDFGYRYRKETWGKGYATEAAKACMDFYLKSDQNMEIPELLDSVNDSMLEKLSDYVVDEPKFSLEDSTTYDDVQKLLLTADKDTIYYTTDGTDPDLTSTKYTSEGIQISEGETTIKAIAVNKKGVPSAIGKKTYTVEFPVEDAPAVSPSTGQYDEAVPIEVKVPEGYTAYYTTDGTDPTTASTKYTGPIDMPKGETLFKVVSD